jgi:hypothetical protein
MRQHFFLSSYRPDNATVTLALLLLVLTHLAPAYDSYKVRQRVTECLHQANQAKALVEVNFAQGNRLDQGWSDASGASCVLISVMASTGMITLTFPADIDGGGKTLILLPAYTKDTNGLPLTTEIRPALTLQEGDIAWLCTSSLTRSARSFIQENTGTLQGKYAPAACRHVPLRYQKAEMAVVK